jgi:hypothetical protein
MKEPQTLRGGKVNPFKEIGPNLDDIPQMVGQAVQSFSRQGSQDPSALIRIVFQDSQGLVNEFLEVV